MAVVLKISSVTDCEQLQNVTIKVEKWCKTPGVKLNTDETVLLRTTWIKKCSSF